MEAQLVNRSCNPKFKLTQRPSTALKRPRFAAMARLVPLAAGAAAERAR